MAKKITGGAAPQIVKIKKVTITFADLVAAGDGVPFNSAEIIPANSMVLSSGILINDWFLADGDQGSDFVIGCGSQTAKIISSSGPNDFIPLGIPPIGYYEGIGSFFYVTEDSPINMTWNRGGTDTTLVSGEFQIVVHYISLDVPRYAHGYFGMTSVIFAKTIAKTSARNGDTLTIVRDLSGVAPATDTLTTGASAITITSLGPDHEAKNGVSISLEVEDTGDNSVLVTGDADEILITVRRDTEGTPDIAASLLSTILNTKAASGSYTLVDDDNLLDPFAFSGGGADLLAMNGPGDGQSATMAGGDNLPTGVTVTGDENDVILNVQGPDDDITTEVLREVLEAKASGTYSTVAVVFTDVDDLIDGLTFRGGGAEPIVSGGEGDDVACTLNGGND